MLLEDFVHGFMLMHKIYRFALVIPDVVAEAWIDFSIGYDDYLRVKQKLRVVK